MRGAVLVALVALAACAGDPKEAADRADCTRSVDDTRARLRAEAGNRRAIEAEWLALLGIYGLPASVLADATRVTPAGLTEEDRRAMIANCMRARGY